VRYRKRESGREREGEREREKERNLGRWIHTSK